MPGDDYSSHQGYDREIRLANTEAADYASFADEYARLAFMSLM